MLRIMQKLVFRAYDAYRERVSITVVVGIDIFVIIAVRVKFHVNIKC